MMYAHQAALCTRIRAQGGYTQRQLAKVMGLSGKSGAQFVSNIERGLAGFPLSRIKKLFTLASRAQFLEAVLADARDNFNRETR